MTSMQQKKYCTYKESGENLTASSEAVFDGCLAGLGAGL